MLGMSTKAVRSPDGASYKIDGSKMWITNGTTDGRTTGDAFLVYARTGPGRQDVSMFIVEKVGLDAVPVASDCTIASRTNVSHTKAVVGGGRKHRYRQFVKQILSREPSSVLARRRMGTVGAQDMPGFRLGQKIEGKCGMRASMTAELVFDGVEASSSARAPLFCGIKSVSY